MEVEAKLALDEESLAALRARLGAPSETRHQQDSYLEVGELPVALRLRQDGDRAWVTLKSGFRKVDGIRMRDEHEPAIRPEELPLWLKLFEALGMPQKEVVAKQREVYPQGDVEVVIDHIEGLSTPYVELEAKGLDGPAALTRLEAAIQELGLAERPRESASYRDLLRRQKSR